jgi:hypothetical protein
MGLACRTAKVQVFKRTNFAAELAMRAPAMPRTGEIGRKAASAKEVCGARVRRTEEAMPAHGEVPVIRLTAEVSDTGRKPTKCTKYGYLWLASPAADIGQDEGMARAATDGDRTTANLGLVPAFSPVGCRVLKSRKHSPHNHGSA